MKLYNVMKFLYMVAAMGIITLSSYSCSEPASPYGQTAITLEALDASCTEVWLELKFSNLTQPADVAIQKDGKDYHRILSLNRDTLLVFENLEPSTNYSFRAIIRYEGKDDKISNTVQVRTMDTTSHNFTWQTFTFGEVGSSSLYDVAIIDENNIWAVGEIYMKDSLGNPNPYAYNAVHWDGNNWTLNRIMFNTICGQTSLSSYPAKAIYKINENDIWIAVDGDQIARLENGVQTKIICLPSTVSMSINKMWGSSSSDLYVVGNGGNIAHYNGTSWQKIESGTTLHINDVWGDYNTMSKKWEILCVGSNQLIDEGRTLLSIEENKATPINDSGLSWALNSIWFKTRRKYIIGGDGLYISASTSEVWKRDISQPPYYKTAVRANGLNDIFVVGAFGLILHYNGSTWHSYLPETYLNNGAYGRVAVKNNIVIATGGQGTKAVLTMGRR
ncbi:MAG: glucosyl transferase [Ignavibacteriaceae bacterium]|nr:glucosyl transferase [Ignavibacteriaceae bacterium]